MQTLSISSYMFTQFIATITFSFFNIQSLEYFSVKLQIWSTYSLAHHVMFYTYFLPIIMFIDSQCYI